MIKSEKIKYMNKNKKKWLRHTLIKETNYNRKCDNLLLDALEGYEHKSDRHS